MHMNIHEKLRGYNIYNGNIKSPIWSSNNYMKKVVNLI